MIKSNEIKEFREEFIMDKQNIIRQRSFYKIPLIDLISSEETSKDEIFDLELDLGNQYNQNHTGRCWCYASSRILNKKISEKLNDPHFEISINYLTFYDKLEKFNILINQFNKKDNNCYDRDIREILLNGIEDGGYFTWFANLIDKYGIVPKNCFSDSYQSNNSNEINNILSRLLRKFYVEVNKDNFEETKLLYMKKAYNILSMLYGLPPKTLSYDYVDANNKKKNISEITPLEFYKKYCDVNLLKEYVEVISYKDDLFKYNNVYEVDKLTNIEEYANIKFLNVSLKRQKELIMKQLNDKEPVCFYSYVTKKQIKGYFTDIYERYGELLNIDLNISKNDILYSNETKNGHAMIISGYKLKNKIPNKWKILNSWPEKEKDIKYYIADNSWLDKYMSCIIINKKYLSKEELNALSKKTSLIDFWSNKIN